MDEGKVTLNTEVSSAGRQVVIGGGRPTTLIGERINPAGKKKLTAALLKGDLSVVRAEATAQVSAGADILDVHVGTAGVDEVSLLPQAVEAIMAVVDVPLSLDSDNPAALEAALKVYKGKPIVNSVNGQESKLREILPLVKEYGAAVIGLAQDDQGIPPTADGRVAAAEKIVEQAAKLGIPREDIIIDCLALTVGADGQAGIVTLEAIKEVKARLGVNQTLGASNISFGLPNREVLNRTFLALAISAGVTCPMVDVAKVRTAITAADLILGRDKFAQRYIRFYRQSIATDS